jgi:excinuclease UvrABC helicase subunit UvrB
MIEDLQTNGIKIPEAAKESYKEKNFIFPANKEFGIAFYDFYYPSTLAGAGKNYIWRAIDKK